MTGPIAEITESFFRRAVNQLVAYEPGKPIDDVKREFGLERCIKLASNEGPYGPFPAALAALAAAEQELNRYPDGNCYALRAALAERHQIRFEEVAVGSGADGLIDSLCQSVLEPGDEIVCGWPSFVSYVIVARKLGATAKLVPLRLDRYDLDGLLDAVGPRTKLVYICHPNNPTGTMNTRDELDAYFARVPEHVLTVIDQAYFEYVDDRDYLDAIEEYAKAGRNALVLRTFSKIYGLAGLRVGYAVGPASVVTAMGKVKRPFDVTSQAQVAALASLNDADEVQRRRQLNIQGRSELHNILRARGFEPAGPAVGNFLYVDVGEDSTRLFERLLRQGVIVRPLHGFGARSAIRITVGTLDEHAFLAQALDVVAPAEVTG